MGSATIPVSCSTSCERRRTKFSKGLLRNEIIEIKLIQEHLHDELGQLVYDRTHRRPMILPVVVEV